MARALGTELPACLGARASSFNDTISITPRIFPQWSQPLVANLSRLQHHLEMVDQDVSLAGYRKELKDAHALVVREFDRSKAQSKPDAIQRIADFCHNSEQEQSLRRVAVSGQ